MKCMSLARREFRIVCQNILRGGLTKVGPIDTSSRVNKEQKIDYDLILEPTN